MSAEIRQIFVIGTGATGIVAALPCMRASLPDREGRT
tara:strand:+ start:10394 stop:10504 length:111 start_codon:yes stop_codon:yes gene_type:complete